MDLPLAGAEITGKHQRSKELTNHDAISQLEPGIANRLPRWLGAVGVGEERRAGQAPAISSLLLINTAVRLDGSPKL